MTEGGVHAEKRKNFVQTFRKVSKNDVLVFFQKRACDIEKLRKIGFV